jgi:hypothetical protein
MSGWVAGAIAVSSVVGASTAKSAAKTQAAAAEKATETQKEVADQQVALQREMYQQIREDQTPWRQAGVNALGVMERTAGNVPGAFKFGAADFTADPGYAFRLAEGRKALASTARARGGLVSGQTLKGMQDYAQNAASQEFQNAYNRAYTGYGTDVARENQLYNRQAALAGVGQTSTNLVGQAGQNYATGVGNALGTYGTNAGNLMTSAGAAQAAGQVGAANAITGGLGTYLNYSQNNALLNALRTPQTGYGTSAGYGP